MTDQITQTPEAQIVADLAQRAADPHPLSDGVWGVVLAGDARHDLIDVEPHLAHPRRKRGTISVDRPVSLAAYVNAHSGPGTALYADQRRLRVVAVLNDHVPEGDVSCPGFGDYRAVLDLLPTPEWTAWRTASGKWMGQEDFADFVEEHVDDVVTPPGADLLELARTFEATKGAQFRSAVRLDSGQRQLTYSETIDARAGQSGQVVIPERFTLGLAPFDGVDAYRIEARLRYRIGEGALRLAFVLDHADRVQRCAFDDVVQTVEADTARPVFFGTPR